MSHACVASPRPDASALPRPRDPGREEPEAEDERHAGDVVGLGEQPPGGPTDAQFEVIDALAAVAAEVDATPAAVALAWLRSRPGVTAPIVGARRLEHLEANLASLDVELSDAQVATLDAVSAPQLDYPYDLNRTAGPMLQFAGTTVDGQESVVYPPLLESASRY